MLIERLSRRRSTPTCRTCSIGRPDRDHAHRAWATSSGPSGCAARAATSTWTPGCSPRSTWPSRPDRRGAGVLSAMIENTCPTCGGPPGLGRQQRRRDRQLRLRRPGVQGREGALGHAQARPGPGQQRRRRRGPPGDVRALRLGGDAMSAAPVTRRCRETGLPVTVAHGYDLGLDTQGEGPWYTLCEEHSEICSHRPWLTPGPGRRSPRCGAPSARLTPGPGSRPTGPCSPWAPTRWRGPPPGGPDRHVRPLRPLVGRRRLDVDDAHARREVPVRALPLSPPPRAPRCPPGGSCTPVHGSARRTVHWPP